MEIARSPSGAQNSKPGVGGGLFQGEKEFSGVGPNRENGLEKLNPLLHREHTDKGTVSCRNFSSFVKLPTRLCLKQLAYRGY